MPVERVLGFRVLGFRVLGFGGLGFRVSTLAFWDIVYTFPCGVEEDVLDDCFSVALRGQLSFQRSQLRTQWLWFVGAVRFSGFWSEPYTELDILTDAPCGLIDHRRKALGV